MLLCVKQRNKQNTLSPYLCSCMCVPPLTEVGQGTHGHSVLRIGTAGVRVVPVRVRVRGVRGSEGVVMFLQGIIRKNPQRQGTTLGTTKCAAPFLAPTSLVRLPPKCTLEYSCDDVPLKIIREIRIKHDVIRIIQYKRIQNSTCAFSLRRLTDPKQVRVLED